MKKYNQSSIDKCCRDQVFVRGTSSLQTILADVHVLQQGIYHNYYYLLGLYINYVALILLLFEFSTCMSTNKEFAKKLIHTKSELSTFNRSQVSVTR